MYAFLVCPIISFHDLKVGSNHWNPHSWFVNGKIRTRFLKGSAYTTPTTIREIGTKMPIGPDFLVVVYVDLRILSEIKREP